MLPRRREDLMHLSEGHSALEVSREVCMSHLQGIDVSTLVATRMGRGDREELRLESHYGLYFELGL